MRLVISAFVLLITVALVGAKPVPSGKDEPKLDKKSPAAFKPVDIDNELTGADGNDPKLNQPAKKYSVKLHKDKTYIIDLVSKDFDAYLRLLDKNGKMLAEDDDGGGELNARIIFAPAESADHEIVATTFDGQLGKFNLKVREFKLKTEAKPRSVGKDGVNVTDNINQQDASDLGKLGKLFSVSLKKDQTYTIDLQSGDFDSYLYLFDGKSKLLAQDDDSGGGLNSRIVFRAPQDGVFHVLATSLGGTETGEFTLNVRKKD